MLAHAQKKSPYPAQTLPALKSRRQGKVLQEARPFLASEERIPSRRLPQMISRQ